MQYSLSPEAYYPTHLRQAAAALNYMLKTGIHPRDMIIGGDSTGGHLAVQLLHHLSHPVPARQVPIPKTHAGPCKTAKVHQACPSHGRQPPLRLGSALALALFTHSQDICGP
ncbi:alpha/beta hydrolase fold domain-containing protein [Candidatus Bathyarchaeota archaeon]|nr:alpha/beta hydrolase fold domain-containing protein [Candidatus Bathyarchaeota archaeon]